MLEASLGAASNRWPDRAWHEAAPTVGANIVQDILYTIGTECTFIAADVGIGCCWWQVFVAVLTVESEL